jgi:uncharacterized protein YprB with RNaseH-like and TPR domain
MAKVGRGNVFKLNNKQTQRLIDLYSSSRKKEEIQNLLAEEFSCTPRTIRKLAKELNLNQVHQDIPVDKVLVYDIETSRVKADLWWTGKQYVGHKQLRNEPTIISIAWKWLGQSKVYSLTWNKDHCDKAMLTKFLKVYNSASMVIGQNNNSFDNKWINTRAAKHHLKVDRFVKSFDIYRMAKRCLRLPSYSMAYMAKYFGLTLKQSHEGIHMWDMIEYGTPKEQKEYLVKMVDYNKGDIVTTEELYLTLRTYFATVQHRGVQLGLPKWSCPITGSKNVKLHKTIFTERGTVQRILYCIDSDYQYKVNNKTYMDYLQRAITDNTI